MALSLPVTLAAGPDGAVLDVWDRYEIALSMTHAGSAWSFSLFRSESRRSNWTVARSLKLGDRLQWSVNNALQLDGVIEEAATHVDREGGAQFVVSGRDLAGPAISWDADPTLLIRGLTLEEALRRLFLPLGIPVIIGEGADATRRLQSARRPPPAPTSTTTRRRRQVDIAHPRPGEKVWGLAESICRRLGYMIWVAPSRGGQLAVVVDTPAYASSPQYRLSRVVENGTVTRDSNLLDAIDSTSIREVPTEVNVYTTSHRGDAVSIRQRVTVANGIPYAPAIGLDRVRAEFGVQPRHVHSAQARTLDAAQHEADRVIADAMIGFRTYQCAVQGHGQELFGETILYAINSMALVRDDVAGLNEPMLILGVTFCGDRDGGQTTRLTLGPKDAIQLLPEAE